MAFDRLLEKMDFSSKTALEIKKSLGCEIFAYDHRFNDTSKRGNSIELSKTKLGFGENAMALMNLMIRNNHFGVVIDYLKV